MRALFKAVTASGTLTPADLPLGTPFEIVFRIHFQTLWMVGTLSISLAMEAPEIGTMSWLYYVFDKYFEMNK